MTFKFSDLIDFSKIPIKVFILLAFVSGILVFGTEGFLEQLKVKKFEASYGMYFGITFIVCCSFIVLSIIYYLVNKIQDLYFERRIDSELEKHLKKLNPAEQSVLREFFITQRSTISMPMDNPVVTGLINKYILVRKSNIGMSMYYPMALSKPVESKLTEYDLGIKIDMSKEQITRVAHNRPKWTSDFIYERANK